MNARVSDSTLKPSGSEQLFPRFVRHVYTLSSSDHWAPLVRPGDAVLGYTVESGTPEGL